MRQGRSLLHLTDPTAHEILVEERRVQKRLHRASQEPGEAGFGLKSPAFIGHASETVGKNPERR